MDKLEELRKVVACGIYIESNIHKDTYEKAETCYDSEFYDVVGKLDYTKDIWTIQVYPQTPVGFIAGISNDIDSLLDWAIEGAKDY